MTIRAKLNEAMRFDLGLQMTGTDSVSKRPSVRVTIDDGEKMVSFPAVKRDEDYFVEIPVLEGLIEPGTHTFMVEVMVDNMYFRAKTDEIWLEEPMRASVTEMKMSEGLDVKVDLKNSDAPRKEDVKFEPKKKVGKLVKESSEPKPAVGSIRKIGTLVI